MCFFNTIKEINFISEDLQLIKKKNLSRVQQDKPTFKRQ